MSGCVGGSGTTLWTLSGSNTRINDSPFKDNGMLSGKTSAENPRPGSTKNGGAAHGDGWVSGSGRSDLRHRSDWISWNDHEHERPRHKQAVTRRRRGERNNTLTASPGHNALYIASAAPVLRCNLFRTCILFPIQSSGTHTLKADRRALPAKVHRLQPSLSNSLSRLPNRNLRARHPTPGSSLCPAERHASDSRSLQTK